ncbi:MAG TPA: peptide ABC transporter permease [Parachlamydiales bacterium]|nr:MAG: peptide ABC transporter permease [Chlamydiae bacterium RIFCSPHIGHO2_02_FULL_49_29]OGN64190.1 MAG: peptide ABC transporter permease [Chlamydiae bacterium RIFCSPHIGHO2_12_FULL_49_32]OGN70542.1 MAG: peptide ABC transporter permease [Chlamydiae bacterium RIFCSPLOWO2_12_FULL_49_12]HAZ15859.1 peptide ABC transporter permease [Parachlamydiales bacterium]HCJ84412.1 peptide ABC transporter permease [Parachlamydiales bacterium]
MKNYLIKKGAVLLCSLFLIATATFFLMHAIPGDPFIQDKAIPEEILSSLRRHYGLDQPLHIQYLKYLKGALCGDLGPSFKYEGRTVSGIISDGFPVSLALGLEALFLSVTAGITLGAAAAVYRSRWQDGAAMLLAVLWISVPSFVLATFLQYLFAMKLDLLPLARWGTFSHTLLPALSLAALPTAVIARMTRANMVEVLGQDFILTARAKGLSLFSVIFRHALKNSLLPVLTYLGPLTATILTGSFAVEKIFGIPGLGQWFVTGIMNRDYTVIMGVTLFYSALLTFWVFIIDLVYPLVDPRICHAKQP